MANELLDFVMSLVRDPEVAARYAADPSGAIADAHLTNVTSADVNNLIPMVSDSLSMAAPTFGVDAGPNVWTSGAATAAFDAFEPHVPETGFADLHDLGGVIDTSSVPEVSSDLGLDLPVLDDPVQFNDIEDASTVVHEDPAGWDDGVIEATHLTDDGGDASSFDLF
ncbi:Rv0340 family IniB-related protein [Mycolicibacterium confluentis]|uniref:Uncharacterized protein n=1 Tax=Mycolicibacterium confluentis TaxID=28047 RepID=A0A7I7Y235_9MYCO|nr:IniB N-terminal domain-containing protein [Mycolicibacterium confluentis]MCV7320588.1 hypothetical protein [Mycolicibacterium confluentis]ORV30241.1 hypothetical protein AWB99_14145 [Mycolicibacterium confluentis]BBZ35629.1 hypothetical protein MCNF_42340 [Mycolicibacterium confluentis]